MGCKPGDKQSTKRTHGKLISLSRDFIYTISAVSDLDEIKAWYQQPGAGNAAVSKLLRLITAIEGIARYPSLYSLDTNVITRVMVSEGHRVIYELNPDTGNNTTAGNVIVLRVLGPRRQ